MAAKRLCSAFKQGKEINYENMLKTQSVLARNRKARNSNPVK